MTEVFFYMGAYGWLKKELPPDAYPHGFLELINDPRIHCVARNWGVPYPFGRSEVGSFSARVVPGGQSFRIAVTADTPLSQFERRPTIEWLVSEIEKQIGMLGLPIILMLHPNLRHFGV